jgi:CheY-like chemotaxis protein
MAQILIVDMKAETSAALTLLGSGGYDVTFAAGFEAAIRRIDRSAPDLLIAEVRLGDFNGLHLVIRSQSEHPHMRSILLDRDYDAVLALEAQQHGATYLADPISAADLFGSVSRLLADSNPQRRWPRKQPMEGLVARVARQRAKIIDISYGGIRLELPPVRSIPARFNMAIPGFEEVFRARPVWTRYTPVGSLSCGAELSEANPQIVARWRQLVDSIHAAS